MADRVVIRSGALTAQIARQGAELWSLQDGAGREWMTDADPAYWTGHAPLLFPIVGRLCDDRYRLDDERTFTMAQHGFARKSLFALVEQEEGAVTFRLESDAQTRAAYPFDFRLDMHYALDGARLAMMATVTNCGDSDMPFSFGYHPAFAWPLPGGGAVKDHRITFAQNEPAPIRRIVQGSGLIARDPVPTPVESNILAPTHALFADDALIWDQINSRSLTWGVPAGDPGAAHLTIDFPDTPWLGLWQKPGAHYLCIEPWAGMADPEGFSGTIWEKPGIVRLAPGDARFYRMDVTLVADN